MKNTHALLQFSPTLLPTNEGAPRRFRGVAYSGGVIPAYGIYGDSAIDLATLSLPSGPIFALVDHDPTQRAGQLIASIQDNTIVVEGTLFSASEAGREVSDLFAEGAPWQMSGGIQAITDSTTKPRNIEMNGSTLKINTIFKNATLREVSFVPIGADPNTSVAAFSFQDNGKTMTIEELQEQITSLTEKLSAQTERAEKAELEIKTIKAATRKESIINLSKHIGRDLTQEEIETLTTIDEKGFISLSGILTFKKPAPDHLLKEQAVDGKSEEGKQTLSQMSATLINQISGKK